MFKISLAFNSVRNAKNYGRLDALAHKLEAGPVRAQLRDDNVHVSGMLLEVAGVHRRGADAGGAGSLLNALDNR